MSGATFADPVVVDWSAPSGTHTFALGTTTPHLVVDSSQNTSSTYFPDSAAVDGSRDTCWETNALGPETSLTLRESDSSAVTVLSYTLVARNGWAGRAPSAFTLYGSNDKTHWTSLDARTGITDWTGASDSTDVKNFILASPATYVFWKLIVTATQGGGIVNLGEIYLNDTENPAQVGPTYYYIKMTGIPRGRIIHVDVAGDIFRQNWQNLWTALVPDYPEDHEQSTGSQYWSPYDGPGPAGDPWFYGIGRDQILKVSTAPGAASFTVSWTSTEAPSPLQPNTWFDRVPIDPTGATVTYNGTDAYTSLGSSRGTRRYYSITPTTTDPITITGDEPSGDWEVYTEDGQYLYDGWIGEGSNFADGMANPDYKLQFEPVVGQEYVIVVYTTGTPDRTTPYTLTLTAAALAPPPYVVSNDLFANPISLGDLTDGLTHAYDNTGATTDVAELPNGKRSIWYTFQVAVDSMVLLTLIPSDTADAKLPSTTLLSADRADVASGGTVTSARLVPGLYHLAISFGSALPTSDWEQHGLMSFTVIPTPPHIADPNFTLQPGSADVGGGQNYRIGPAFPGSSLGSQGVAHIVAPYAGGLSIIIEAEAVADGTFYRPSASVRLLRYADGNGAPVHVDTNYAATDYGLTDPRYWADPTVALRMPSRPVGTTAVEPITFTVKAGDVIEVDVTFSSAGCYIRWGMTTEMKPSSPWISARYGDVVTHDGTVIPSMAQTQGEADELRANVRDWPLLLDLGTRPIDVPTNLADQGLPSRASAWTFANDCGLKSPRSDIIVWQPIEQDLDPLVHGAVNGGGNGPGREVDTYPAQTDVWANISGYIMDDPADARTDAHMTTNLHVVRQQSYVLRDGRVERGGSGSPSVPYSPQTIAANMLVDAMRPVTERGQQGALDSYRVWGDSSGLGALIRHLTWVVEWDGVGTAVPKEIYNVYFFSNIAVHRTSGGVGAGDGPYPLPNLEPNPDYPASSIYPARGVDSLVQVFAFPVEATDQPWLSPETIVGGEIVDEISFPNESMDPSIPAVGESHGPSKSRVGGLAYEQDLLKADILSGAAPTAGAKLYDNTYAMLTAAYRDGYFNWGLAIAAYWDRKGYINEASPGKHDQYAVGTMFFAYNAFGNVHTTVARQYPGTFRISLWTPSLAAIAPVEPQPAAGSTLTATQDIAGEPGAVAVHFATT